MRRFALAPIAALGLVLALGAPAHAGFAPANDEIAAAEQLSANGLATDAGGRSIIVWSQETPPAAEREVRARFLEPGGGLGPPIELAPGEAGVRPEVAMTPSGRAFAAWSAGGIPYSAKGRWIEPDGSLGPLLTLVEGGPDEDAAGIQVVVDPAGVATVVWDDQADFELNLRRVEPDGTLGTLVPDIADGGATGEEIVALPDGGTVAVWRGGGIELNIVDANLTVGTPSQISEPGLVSNPRIAVDSLGQGLAIWRMSVGEDDSLRGRRFDSTGAVGAELKIDPDAETEVGSVYDVAADTQGDFLVTWSREDAEEDAIVYARRGNSLGVPVGPAQPLSLDGEDGIGPTPALADGGSGSVVWRKDLGSGNYLTFGRAVDPLAAPLGGTLEIFPEGGETEAAAAPALGFAAFLVEYPISGSARAAIVRRFMPPPTCSDSTASVVQGQPTEASLACTGLAIEGAQVLEQPQHGAIGPFDPAARTLTYTPTPGFEGTDSFTYAALNDGGGSNPARVSVAVGRDTVAPRITSFRFVQMTKKKKKAGARAAAKKPKPKQRTYEFRLKFSEAATSRVKVERASGGIRKGKRCVKATKGARGKSCTRWRSIGNVSGPAAGTEATLRVGGKLAKALRKGGRFRAKAFATDVAGNGSKPRTLGFRVKPSGR